MELQGVFVTAAGPVAQVKSPQKTATILLLPGDLVGSGEVVSIRYEKGVGAEVVFREPDTSAGAPRPLRTVIKRLEH